MLCARETNQIQKRIYYIICCLLSSGLVKLTLGRNKEEWFPMEEWGVALTKKGQEETFRTMIMVLLDVWVSQVCAFVKTQSGTLKICLLCFM